MNHLINNVNIFIVLINIIGLGSYIFIRTTYLQKYQYILVLFIVSCLSLQKYINSTRIYFWSIAIIAIITTFIDYQIIDLTLVSISLALAVKLGYFIINKANIKEYQKIKFYESLLNIALSLSIILSICCHHFKITKLTQQIIILITTLPNLYLSLSNDYNISNQHQHHQKHHHNSLRYQNDHHNIVITNMMIFYLNPFYNKTWAYALGYAIGVCINWFNLFGINKITKNVKYLAIGLFLLIETLTLRQQINVICSLIRSILVFHFQQVHHKIEAYFIFVSLILMIFFNEDVVNIYLMIGYVIISFTIQRQNYQNGNIKEKKQEEQFEEQNSSVKYLKHQYKRDIDLQIPLIDYNTKVPNNVHPFCRKKTPLDSQL